MIIQPGQRWQRINIADVIFVIEIARIFDHDNDNDNDNDNTVGVLCKVKQADNISFTVGDMTNCNGLPSAGYINQHWSYLEGQDAPKEIK